MAEETSHMVSTSTGQGRVQTTRIEDKKCCEWRRFQGSQKAQGYAFAATGHGSIFISGVFLSRSLIYLAYEEANCLDEDKEIVDDCPNQVHSFSPDALITNIYVFATLLAALLLPSIGAIIDYTPFRRPVGRWVAASIILIQVIQIGTVSQTWFPMAILQAILGALYEIHHTLTTSYLPDIARYDVDSITMNQFNRTFYILQFGGEVLFILMLTLGSEAAGFGTVRTAQLGQCIGSVWLIVCFMGAWKQLPNMPPRHRVPSSPSRRTSNIFVEGFRQNWRTFGAIYSQSESLTWFYTAVAVGEAGVSTLLPIAVNLLTTVLNYSTLQVAACFLLTLVSSLPGVLTNAMISKRSNPRTSLMSCLAILAIVTFIAIFIIKEEEDSNVGYILAVLWGYLNGWYYAGLQLLYSFVVPAGQEAELAGFYVFCTIILTWVPTLIYSIVVENDVDAALGLIPLVFCQISAVVALKVLPTWDRILEESKRALVLYLDDDDAGTSEGNLSVNEARPASKANDGVEDVKALQPVDGPKLSTS